MACTLTAATACGDSKRSDKPSATPTVSAPVTHTSKPTPTNNADQTKTQLIELYKAYWAQMEKAYAKGSVEGTGLSEYAAGLALVAAEKDMASQYKAGNLIIGNVTVGNPTVMKIDLDRKVPSASISSCLDVSQWKVIDRDTKKEVDLPKERLLKYVITTVVERWPEGWRVIKDEPQDKAC
ncbi:hypothetical protein [Streptomyces sp. NPDC048350]|uniref:hypothetical protein n=1 Tax=Streptomyces sp. NPDC048350 TaxID=3365538 RepID=UPI0037156D6C